MTWKLIICLFKGHRYGPWRTNTHGGHSRDCGRCGWMMYLPR